MIDQTAIQIRPYTKEDNDQVISILYTGFVPVGERYFQERARTTRTALTILIQSLIYSSLIELALAAYSTSTTSSFSLQDLNVLKEILMQPQTQKGMVTQFLKPSFMALSAVVTMVVAVVHLIRLYKLCTSGTDRYIQEQMKDDLADISTYYQSGAHNSQDKDKKAESTGRNTRSKAKKAADRSQFWVVCLTSHPQVILGCVAAEDLSAHQDHLRMKHEKMNAPGQGPFEVPSKDDCELRRMSVHPDYRRLGIGKMLLVTLRDHAKKHGFKRVVLSTTFYQPAGYKKFGFVKEKTIIVDDFFRIWFGQLDISSS